MKKNKNVMLTENKSTLFFKNKNVLIMKKLLLLTLMLTNVLFANGTTNQQQTNQNLLKKITKDNLSLREIPLDQYTSLKRVKENIDKKGNGHTKFQLTKDGVIVENHIVIAHVNGNEISMGGKVIPDFKINTNPTLTEPEANQIAIYTANVTNPIWDIEEYEILKKKVENDPNATNRPNGELVIYDGNYSYDAAQYRLAYKFQIYSIKPLSHKTIYVDAHTGIILGNIENTHNCSETCNPKQVNGTTNYNGEVNLEVCCESNVCFLDSEKGGGITVYDSEECYCSPLTCVVDENGNFTDPTANEVYSTTHQYYNFLLEVFNRKSIDDEDHPLIAFIHYGEDLNNAYWWNGGTYYGDGDGVYANSFTTADIVGHEFTHGLINHTANLNYVNESGALNESFADIFGLLLEDYINGQTDWAIGNDFMLRYSAIRNVANPNDPTLRRKYPDTYLGDNYYTGEGDNGGVHINSSIQNYWFYLLSEGGSGVNDNGYAYNIEGIGIDAAAEIAYQNLTNYLTPTSQFSDARDGAIQAAKAIFGEDSEEARQTELAWCAVGVGECNTVCNRTLDSLALRAFYFSTNGDNWDIPWDLEKSIDNWAGVTLNEFGCVVKLNAYRNNLTGILPPEIGNLSSLEELTLYQTQIGGEIPKEIEKLINLKILILHDLELVGNIPPEIGNLTQLEILDLYLNLLDGSIPPEIGQLNNLKILNLKANPLAGEIPVEIFSLINLEELNLEGLSWIDPELGLTGSILKEVGNLINLKILNLSSNNLTGVIPDEIGNLSQLEELALWSNNLQGNIPITIGQLKNIKIIALGFNGLSGPIPVELAQLDSLTHLALYRNQLTGSIPSELCDLDNLVELALSFNQLTGCYPQCFSKFCGQLEIIDNFNMSDGTGLDATWEEFCATGAGVCKPPVCNRTTDSLALRALYFATAGANWTNTWDLMQPIDTWYGITLDENGRVTCIDLDGLDDCIAANPPGNNLFGTIPPEIGNLCELKYLIIAKNDLIGSIPSEIGKLSKLETMNLSINNLTDEIPKELGNLKNLRLLNLSSNKLFGNIPSTLGYLSNLNGLYLSYNQLTGSIPVELENLSELKFLYLIHNQLSGKIPQQISNLTKISILALNNNELSGAIPVEFENLSELKSLHLGDNQLTGNIPSSFSGLSNLYRLWVSGNYLSGCYHSDLFDLLCDQLPNSSYFDGYRIMDGNKDISSGNNFDATWEEFCATKAGVCVDDFVLPGDFNNDGCLSYLDILIWGLAEGNTGPAREMPTNNFEPQLADDWEAEVNGVNGKHQDANGDGVVNEADLYVFVDNYTAQENRCGQNEASRMDDFLNFISIKEVGNQKIDGTTKRQKTYEIYIESKIENQKVSLHGLELGLTFKEFTIHSVDLDASNFNAEVDTVTSLEGLTYRFAITRTDNGSSIFDINIPAAILIVTIDDVESGEERTVDEIVSSGSMIDPGAGIHPMALQGASTFIVSDNEVEENNYSMDVVRSPSKGIVEVYVNTNNGVDKFIYQAKPGAEECESNITQELIDDCTVKISDGCSINETIFVESSKCPNDIYPPNDDSFNVHPNPATSYTKLILKSEHCNQQIQSIEIFDVTGYLVKIIQPNKQGDCNYKVDVNDLSTGIYFINMLSGDRILNGKFMKQ